LKTQTKDANTKRQIERWQKLFKDKETRYGYIDGFLDSFLSMQIKVLREQRGWTQTELGDKTDMKQTRISLLESMNYSSWSLDVLRRFAKAFDLRLVVKFEDFGSYVREYFEDFDTENLKRRPFDEDVIFGKRSEEVERFLAQNDGQSETIPKTTKFRTRKVARASTSDQPELPNLGLVSMPVGKTSTETEPNNKVDATTLNSGYKDLLKAKAA
jgi:transcriptional regulator with XRE-family HTH domain